MCPVGVIVSNMAQHTKTEETARGALQTLMDVTHVTVVQVQGVLGLKSRQGVYDKLSGKTKLNLKDIDRLTGFFQIPAFVLFMEKPELLTWMGSSGWSERVADEFPCEHDWPAAA